MGTAVSPARSCPAPPAAGGTAPLGSGGPQGKSCNNLQSASLRPAPSRRSTCPVQFSCSAALLQRLIPSPPPTGETWGTKRLLTPSGCAKLQINWNGRILYLKGLQQDFAITYKITASFQISEKLWQVYREDHRNHLRLRSYQVRTSQWNIIFLWKMLIHQRSFVSLHPTSYLTQDTLFLLKRYSAGFRRIPG